MGKPGSLMLKNSQAVKMRVLKMCPLTKTHLISPLKVRKVMMMRRKKFEWQ